MSASCIAYCFDTFTSYCQSRDDQALKEFICDTLGYKPVLPRELFQEHRWLLDEGALSEWLIEYLNDHLSDHDAVNALVEGAFECPTADSRKALVNQCLTWLKDYPPVGAIRAQTNTDFKTVVLTNTTADSSVLLSLKTELADAKRELNKKTHELAKLQSEYESVKRESKSICENFISLTAKHYK
jgi:hypothetical protein